MGYLINPYRYVVAGGGLVIGTNGESFKTATTGTTTTHAFTGLAANTFIVLTLADERTNITTPFVVADTALLTWTRRTASEGGAGGAGTSEIWTAFFAAGGNTTITATCSAAVHRSSAAYFITGVETTFGGATAGNAAASQTAPSLAITTTRAGSTIICVSSDFNAVAGSTTFRTPPTHTMQLFHDSSQYKGRHYLANVTTAAAYTMGMTAPTGQSSSTEAIEVRVP